MENETVQQARTNARTYQYERDGFAVSPGPLLDPATTAELRERAERVLRGVYETGRAPRTNSGGPDVASHASYIEASFAHEADQALANVLHDSRIVEFVVAMTGAKRLQVWNVMVMKKYPRSDNKTIVGWHQDQRYLRTILDGPSINCWIALDEVSHETGPLRFVRGSHEWGQLYSTGFFEHDTNKQREEIVVPQGKEWFEVESPLPAGWASIHHPLTLHGSGMCYGSRARCSMLINFAIDGCRVLPGQFFATRIDDSAVCPVVYGSQ